MKKILLTGSTGFLGKHFINYIHKHFPNQFQIIESNTQKNNLLDTHNQTTNKLIDSIGYNNQFDYIFHFAAKTKAGDWCLKHTGEQWLDNQQINTNIIKFWKDYSPNAIFIGIGTSCSYGDDWRKDEANYLTYEPEPSLYTYAYTKRMLYLGMDAMKKQYGMNYCYFVPSTLYGTQFSDNDNHFIYDIIRKFYNAKYNDGLVEIWGNGYAKRELTWVEDFIKLMLEIVFEKTQYHNRIINIASGQERTIENYYKKICELLEPLNPELFWENKVYKNTEKYVGMKDNKLITTIPEAREFHYKSLNEGLKELVKYYKALKYD